MVPRRGPFLTRTTKRQSGSLRATSLDVCIAAPEREWCTYTTETDFSEHRVRNPPISQGIGSIPGLGARPPDWDFLRGPAAGVRGPRTTGPWKTNETCHFQ